MQIVLMRHGRPMLGKHARLNAAEFGGWVREYNAAGIDAGHPPPQEAIAQARRCAITVCSHLARSLESARALGVGQVGLSSPLFREMDMPCAQWRFPRLSASAWTVLFRLAWACGYASEVESFRAARLRAHRCADRLAELASVHDTVLFVGHGSLNWFIARSLARMGWSSDDQAPRAYWQYSVHRSRPT